MPTEAYQVSASNQDCLAYKNALGNWQFKLDQEYVAAGYKSFGQRDQESGLFFLNIPIPPGSKISSAQIIWRSSENRDIQDFDLILKSEDTATPTPYSTLADWQSRTWSPLFWPWDMKDKTWNKDVLYSSPDLSKQIQSIINLPGWVSGNPLSFKWSYHPHPGGGANYFDRVAYSFDGKPTEAPRLEITYTPPTPPTPLPPPPLPAGLAFFEHWGTTLTQNNPWQQNIPALPISYELSNSLIHLFNPPIDGAGIKITFAPSQLPLLKPANNHLYAQLSSKEPEPTTHNAYIALFIDTTDGTNTYRIELVITRGDQWGPWGNLLWATAATAGKDYGLHPEPIDITAFWLWARRTASLSSDPTGWYINNIALVFEGVEYEPNPYLINDFIALVYSPTPFHDITQTEPFPAPPQPELSPPPPPRKGWAALDVYYEYLDNGFKITLFTDVPCHCYCRMTKTPPRKHIKPVMTRGLRTTGDIRFCFVNYEDNEQEEPGDTLIHTFLKPNWPICETRYFYFIGSAYGDTSEAETAIFKFHFPAPPPPPPPPLVKYLLANPNNRTIYQTGADWDSTHDAPAGIIADNYDAPWYLIPAGTELTASFFIYRGFLSFDTSLIPIEAKITAATLELWVTGKHTNLLPYTHLQITQGIQHDPIIPADYGNQLPYTAILGQINIPNIIPGQYNSIPFNEAGLAKINPGGITQLCLRGEMDILDIPSIWVYVNYIGFHSQQKGAGYRPFLKVSYYPA